MTYDEISAPLCLFCKRVRYDRSKPIDTCYSCEAYPDKIPKAIWSNKVYHVLPFEGDHGIMFVPKDEDLDVQEIIKLEKERRSKSFTKEAPWSCEIIEHIDDKDP